MANRPESSSLNSIRRNLFAGAALTAIFVGALSVWAASTEVAGAVIAPGGLVVDSSVKKVQHPVGGIVAEIRARDGQRVRAGEVVLRLDATAAQANLAIITKSLDELAIRKARLESERDGEAKMALPAEIAARAAERALQSAAAAEIRLFDLRLAARRGQKAQLKERTAQLDEEIRGLRAQSDAKSKEIGLIERELTGVRELRDKNLVPLAKLTSLEREAARIDGERGQLVASIARAKAKIVETGLQEIQVDQDLRSEVARELRDIQAKSAELAERRIAAEDQLRRIDIRAPADGIVHQLAVHTVGGVIGQGDTLMLVVPDEERLVIDAKVGPQDIDQLRVGQPALLRFSTLNQRTTPEINGRVTLVSADLVTDARTGAAHYAVRIGLSEGEIARLGGVKLVPGMPVEAYFRTEPRTILSYLAKPLSDQIARAFRER